MKIMFNWYIRKTLYSFLKTITKRKKNIQIKLFELKVVYNILYIVPEIIKNNN